MTKLRKKKTEKIYQQCYIAEFPKNTKVLSMMDSKWGIVISTNKGGYLLNPKTHKLKKLKL